MVLFLLTSGYAFNSKCVVILVTSAFTALVVNGPVTCRTVNTVMYSRAIYAD